MVNYIARVNARTPNNNMYPMRMIVRAEDYYSACRRLHRMRDVVSLRSVRRAKIQSGV